MTFIGREFEVWRSCRCYEFIYQFPTLNRSNMMRALRHSCAGTPNHVTAGAFWERRSGDSRKYVNGVTSVTYPNHLITESVPESKSPQGKVVTVAARRREILIPVLFWGNGRILFRQILYKTPSFPPFLSFFSSLPFFYVTYSTGKRSH